MKAKKFKSKTKTMYEFHVDDAECLQAMTNEKYVFGGQTRKFLNPSQKPVVIFGQDECIFQQYLFRKKQWVGPNGERALLPKSDGYGIMVSAFQSREFGFGMDMSDSELEAVNIKKRRGNQRYADEEASQAVHGSIEKQDLKHSPFVQFFEYGASNEGYWDYNHMVIQLEDCVDCLKTLHPNFDFIFLFDHSSGHAKKRRGGLDATAMNRGFGGSQTKIRPTLIRRHEGFFGPLS